MIAIAGFQKKIPILRAGSEGPKVDSAPSDIVGFTFPQFLELDEEKMYRKPMAFLLVCCHAFRGFARNQFSQTDLFLAPAPSWADFCRSLVRPSFPSMPATPGPRVSWVAAPPL